MFIGYFCGRKVYVYRGDHYFPSYMDIGTAIIVRAGSWAYDLVRHNLSR